MADADAVVHPSNQTYALVTGANRGIGLEICRQLASKGMVVILGSRSEESGLQAQRRLAEEFDDDLVLFHQLDVVDPASVVAVVDFIRTRFGKLDILVNNAGDNGIDVVGDISVFKEYVDAENASVLTGGQVEPFQTRANGKIIESLKRAEECIETNYYGVKRLTEALIPLLQLSHSTRIVNISSTAGSLMFLSNEWAKGVLSEGDSLTVERVDQVVQQFLNDLKDGLLEQKHWPRMFGAYKVSKAALNAYTQVTAKKYPNFCINSVCPGFVKTDMSYNFGTLSTAEAATAPVKLALLPHGGPSGYFFSRTEALSL